MSKICGKCSRALSGGEKWCLGCGAQLARLPFEVVVTVLEPLACGTLAFATLLDGIQNDNGFMAGIAIVTWIIGMTTIVIQINRMRYRVIEVPDLQQGNEELR